MPRGLPTKGWRRRRGSLNATTITRILDAIEEGVPDCHASVLAGGSAHIVVSLEEGIPGAGRSGADRRRPRRRGRVPGSARDVEGPQYADRNARQLDRARALAGGAV